MNLWPFNKSPTLTLGTFGPSLLRRPFVLSGKDIATHKHVMGLTGQGKSKLLASIFVQLLNQGIPCGLIDPHSDLATDILTLLSDGGFFKNPKAFEKLLYIEFGQQNRFLPFNVLSQPYDAHTVSRNLVEVCKRAWVSLADGAAPQFENILLASSLVLVENALPLTALPKLLTDKPYRDGLLNKVSDHQVVDFFVNRFDRWGKEAPLMIESTLRRAFLLTFSPTLRYSLGQKENALNFRELMDKKVSVIFNLGGLDEDTQRFLGCLITVGYEVAALSRSDLREEKRSQYHLIADEFSMFSATSEEALARVLSLARKYGLFLVMAHQTWSQLSQRLQGALQNSVEIAFKLGRSDAQWAAPRFGEFDPYAVKHNVADPAQVDRTHPVYFSVQETFEAWAKDLENLKAREAFVKVGQKTGKIRTLTVRAANSAREEVNQVRERYTKMLMTPKEKVQSEVDPPIVSAAEHTVYRRVPVAEK